MTEMIDSKTDLKPCPFCGSNLKLVETKPDTYGNQNVRCYECPCDGPEADNGFHESKWNSAYCWKRIEQLEKELATVKELSELRFKDLCREQKKNFLIESENENLSKYSRALIAHIPLTERLYLESEIKSLEEVLELKDKKVKP